MKVQITPSGRQTAHTAATPARVPRAANTNTAARVFNNKGNFVKGRVARIRRVAQKLNITTEELEQRLHRMLKQKIKEGLGDTPAADMLAEGASQALKKGSKILQTKVGESVKIGVPTINDEEDIQDQHWSTTSAPSKRRVTGSGKIYYLKDRITCSRPKWLRQVMKERPRVTVVVRDDNAALSAGSIRANQRVYSNCGFNRKGVYEPQQTSQVLRTNPAEFNDSSYGYYYQEYPTRSWCFWGQDYNKVLFLELLEMWIVTQINAVGVEGNGTPNNTAASKKLGKTTNFWAPLLRRRLHLSIISRNAYTDTAVTMYIVQNKSTHVQNCSEFLTKWDDPDSVVNGLASDLVYTNHNESLLNPNTGDAFSPDRKFRAETSIHLEATPFMSDSFKKQYDVVKVHKFILKPSDIMEYTLSVGMPGFDVQHWMDIDHTGRRYHLRGDYQVLITYQGAKKYTVGYMKGNATATSITFPNQLAVDGVTNSCEIAVRSKVTMDVAYEDYYDLKVGPNNRKSNWDGTRDWIFKDQDQVGLVANNMTQTTVKTYVDNAVSRATRVERMLESIRVTRTRDILPKFNVALHDIKDPDRATNTVSGYYLQLETQKTFRTDNTTSDPTPNIVGVEARGGTGGGE